MSQSVAGGGSRGVDTTDLTYPSSARATRWCGLTVLGFGAAGLVGWATKQPILLGLRASYIPMAPNTALAFVVMGLGLLAVVGRGRGARGFAFGGGRCSSHSSAA